VASTNHKRVILKLSGEAFSLPDGKGVNVDKLTEITTEIAAAHSTGARIGIVNGAGNFVRGKDFAGSDVVEPITADYMGMMATIINSLALRDSLKSRGIPATVFSAMPAPTICDHYYRPEVIEQMDGGTVAIFAGGTGHPGVTTDMCAAIRANETGAEIILKATKVDGVYDKDPESNSDAVRYDKLTLGQAVAEKLGVMDLASLAFCMDKGIPVRVFNMSVPGNLLAAVNGEDCGTLVTAC